jgi:hypothetical protein
VGVVGKTRLERGEKIFRPLFALLSRECHFIIFVVLLIRGLLPSFDLRVGWLFGSPKSALSPPLLGCCVVLK